MLFLSAPAIASDENTQNIGISLDSPLTNPNRLTVRKFIDETTVMYAGIGLFFLDHSTAFSTTSTNSSTTFSNTQIINRDSYSLAFGVRRFLSRDNLSTFMDLELTGSYSESRGSNQSSYTGAITLMPAYGVEYFLSPNVSIEAKAGIPLGYSNTNSWTVSSSTQATTSTTSSTTKSIQSPRLATAITYYW